MATFKVGVVGSGNMGAGIAQKMALEGLLVTIVDLNDEAVKRGLGIIEKTLKEGVERKVFTPEKMQETLARITGSASYEALADMDLVVEAVFEDKDVKVGLFQKLDEICEAKTIFASNTSSFYIHELANKTKRPDRVVGMHYFYHPAKNRLLEIIPHDGTSKETTDRACLIGKLHGKTNIIVKDAPGFAVNRFFVPFLTSSVRALEEGVANIPTIEEAAKKAFTIGMGPFELMNITGIPIAAHSSHTLGEELSPFYATPDLLNKQTDSGELWDLIGDVDESKLEAVADFLYGTALGVACQLVDEGVASKEDTDRGAKVGLRWKLGPFELMNKIGLERTYRCVEAVSKRYEGFPIPETLKKQYESGKPFEFNYVDYAVENNIARITINRPEAMNALNPTVVGQLKEKFDMAEADPSVKAIAFYGAGKAFVAGADIKFFVDNIKANTLDKNVTFTKDGHDLLRRFETCKKPTIAVVEGLSLGGGTELALACQAIVGTESASFAFPETGIGIYPGLGGMLRSAKIFGKDIAKYYVLTGRGIRAKDAAALGIITKLATIMDLEKTVNEVADNMQDKYRGRTVDASYVALGELVKDGNLDKLLAGEIPTGADQALAEKTTSILKSKAPIAIKLATELIDAQENVSIDEGIKLELDRLVEIFSTEDALLGLTTPPGTKVEFKNK